MTDDQLLAQMREANERLVVTTVRAEQLAEEARTRASRPPRMKSGFVRSLPPAAAIVWRATADGVISFEPQHWCSFTGLIGRTRVGSMPFIPMIGTA